MTTTTDQHGFPIDPNVGYARGKIIQSPLEEAQRRMYALQLIRERSERLGADRFYNITGLHRNFSLPFDKLHYGEEWVGPAYYWDELETLARDHFGGTAEHDVVVLNRCSAGIIASCLAIIKPGSKAISLVPGKRGHPSISRGMKLAGAEILQVNYLEEVSQAIDGGNVSFMMITGVSSELEVIDQDIMLQAIALAKKAGIPVMLDDAYGTRLRPIIYGQPKTMETGVNLAVTACDKAGMGGPRAGLMVGEPQYMALVNTKAAELGQEARSPIAAAIWSSLMTFTSHELEEEVAFGNLVYEGLVAKYGSDKVVKSGIGASLPADNVYTLVKEIRNDGLDLPVAPCEVTMAIGMVWLRKRGIISVSAMGQPGASIWLRFKPEPKVVEQMGGIDTLIDAIDEGIQEVAIQAHSLEAMRSLILGS